MSNPMRVAELWRYPIKSMAGERLDRATLTTTGVAGDRAILVRNARGEVVTSRTHPGLLGLHASLGADGQARVDGEPWTSASVLARLRTVAGADAELAPDEALERFDVLPLLVATDGAIARLGVDARRLRPNLVIAGVDGLAERAWEGRRLRVGAAVIAVATLRRRCVMTTYDPDTLAQDTRVLRRIVKELDGRVSLDCSVEEPGEVGVGDPVSLL